MTTTKKNSVKTPLRGNPKTKTKTLKTTTKVTKVTKPSKTNENVSVSVTNRARSYKHMGEIEHILKRPDMYIGTTGQVHDSHYLMAQFEPGENGIHMEKRSIVYTPACAKGFDEILVNAIDHSVEMRQNNSANPVTHISVSLSDTEITVLNDGEGIPIEYSDSVMEVDYVGMTEPEKRQLLVPELIFGQLRSGSNYDDDKERITGGMNGLGAKLTIVYSKWFTIETVDSVTHRCFKQRFENNMEQVYPPEVTTVPADTLPYTKISFQPDYEKFSMPNGLTDDMRMLLERRVIDACACTDEMVKVSLNGIVSTASNFESYIPLFLPLDYKKNYVYTKLENRLNNRIIPHWELGVSVSPTDEFQQRSFVNGIDTHKGGQHVTSAATKLANAIIAYIQSQKDYKELTFSPTYVKSKLWIFLNATVIKPRFTSQTKEEMRSSMKESGFQFPKITEELVISILELRDPSSGDTLLNEIVRFSEMRQSKALLATDGKKCSQLFIPKLRDAAYAGTSKSLQCTIIFTEGDSACSMAIAGLGALTEKEKSYFGVFPLRGKVLNVRDKNPAKIAKNKEILNMKKIIGLEQGRTYTTQNDMERLRYGRVIVFTDQDHDGTHIKGLIVNFIEFFWPALLKREGFLCDFQTPIVKVFRRSGKMNKLKPAFEFTTQTAYDEWKKTHDTSKYQPKYYKGLGTSSSVEAKQYFERLSTCVRAFTSSESRPAQLHPSDNENPVDPAIVVNEIESKDYVPFWQRPTYWGDLYETTLPQDAKNNILLAFSKHQRDARKDWLVEYDSQIEVLRNDQKIEFGEFINKELIHFSNADNQRSLPHIIDGFKTVQRKIIYALLDRTGMTGDIRVPSLGGYVTEKTAYHHGDTSMHETIVGLAQDFIGSNNLNLLCPEGQFGTRLEGGKDHAQFRYISTKLQPYTKKIFNTKDMPILKYKEDDGTVIEPEFLLPVIPMLLVNGSEGIGTGYSTKTFAHNPLELVDRLLAVLANEKQFSDFPSLIPWYRGFEGTITKSTRGVNSFCFKGKCHFVRGTNKLELHVTALPIGVWANKYEEYLERLRRPPDSSPQLVSAYSHIGDELCPGFKVTLTRQMSDDHKPENVHKAYNLIRNDSEANNHLHTPSGKIKKYSCADDILRDFYTTRIYWYQKRKEYWIASYESELQLISSKVVFVLAVVNKELEIRDVPESIPIAFCEQNQLVKQKGSYNYLLDMALRSLSQERVKKLKDEHLEVEKRLHNLRNKTPAELWIEDLNELRDTLVKMKVYKYKK